MWLSGARPGAGTAQAARAPSSIPGRDPGGVANAGTLAPGRVQTWRMRSRPASVLASSVVLGACLLAGCSTASTGDGPAGATTTAPATTAAPPATGKPVPLGAADWPTYHRD